MPTFQNFRKRKPHALFKICDSVPVFIRKAIQSATWAIRPPSGRIQAYAKYDGRSKSGKKVNYFMASGRNASLSAKLYESLAEQFVSRNCVRQGYFLYGMKRNSVGLLCVDVLAHLTPNALIHYRH